MVPGVRVNLNGKYYVVPALTTGGVRATRNARNVLKGLDITAQDLTDDQLNAIHEFVLTALKRNYPALTLEDMDELVDLRTVGVLIQAITGATGLVVVETEEGEAPAAAGKTNPPATATPNGISSTVS